jgi:hypothetical protein
MTSRQFHNLQNAVRERNVERATNAADAILRHYGVSHTGRNRATRISWALNLRKMPRELSQNLPGSVLTIILSSNRR